MSKRKYIKSADDEICPTCRHIGMTAYTPGIGRDGTEWVRRHPDSYRAWMECPRCGTIMGCIR